ncbi:DegT/DnrJ/EryC1/StrS aminotransferase family protein [Methanothermobacter thermautotrophicus]|uniref:DegT/DnrJ/EryC1/StrS aminotransferase family protein n=1 Tax=Methanothermobacter thermautotrophicus TaxID=145262 RepID=A0A842YL19_METTF|nr:DegT/DnrJ/EryC1/StrS family aminotransferase [Methanothermobacter thermautotrophicus]MBE2899657.1 DegT/DnrJ/EryC1/StrS aminotransferase family protein [Methanothermobacter thermautotrophicus]
MKLKFREPSAETRRAVCRAALYGEVHDPEARIREVTGHRYARLLNSGNAAILLLSHRLEGPFLVPDQGGWRGFRRIPEITGREVLSVETDRGLLDPDVLDARLDETGARALLVTSFAGYTAEQPIRELSDVCRSHGALLVEDASGSVSDPLGRLCNGKISDIIIASTGAPKTVNAGGGGFISTSIPEIVQQDMLLSALKADPYVRAAVALEMEAAERNLTETLRACSYLKENLEGALHPERRGINVIIPSGDPQGDVSRLRRVIDAGGRSIFTRCPSYDRVLESAVAVEVKNLDVDCLTYENLEEMAELISSTMGATRPR